MSLWKRIRKLIPIGLFAASSIYLLSNRQDIVPMDYYYRYSVQERAMRARHARDYLIKTFLYGTALSLGALGITHIVQKSRGKKPTFLQPAVENPLWSGLITGASYGVVTYSQLNAYALLVAATVGVWAYMTSLLLKPIKPPYLINYAKCLPGIIYCLFIYNPEKRLRMLKRMRSYFAEPKKIDIDIIDVLFKQRKIDEACNLLKDTVSAITPLISSTPFERYFVQPISTELVRQRNETTPSLELIYLFLKQGDFKEAFDEADTFASRVRTPTTLAARAYLVQSLSDILPTLKKTFSKIGIAGPEIDYHVKNAWKDTIDAILSDPLRESRFRLMGESRNEVIEYVAGEFLTGLLVFKRCNENEGSRLRREQENLLALREKFGDRIARSLAYVEHNGKAYHVLLHGTSRTLEDVLMTETPDKVLSSITSAAELLAQIHKCQLPVHLSVIGENYYINRLITCFYEQMVRHKACINMPASLPDELAEAGRRIQKALADADTGFYKDANPRNWLVEGNGRVVAIDFEHNIIQPVQLDLVSLLEFGPAPAASDVRDVVLSQYLDAFYSKQPFNCDKFMQHYRIAALQRHLELAGYRVRDGEFDAVRFHIHRARECALDLGEKLLEERLAKIQVTGAGSLRDH